MPRQAVELPTPGATLPGHISSLVDGDLRPLKAGLLAAGDTFVYMNARGAGYGVLDCPLSALIRMPLLDAYIRLPVAGAPDVDMSRVSLRRPDIRVSARTMGSLRAHFLEGRRPIFLNEDYQLRCVVPPAWGSYIRGAWGGGGKTPGGGHAMAIC